MEELISIIVPIYNAEKYLDTCLASIINQTYKNLEIILVNDGSTDSSEQICQQFANKDKRIIIKTQINSGLVRARKAGLALSHGEYIAFVDADDHIDGEMYEYLHQVITEYDVDLVHTGMIVDGKAQAVPIARNIDFSSENRVEFINDYVLGSHQILYGIWSKLFKADVIKNSYESLNDKQSYGEDLLCMINYFGTCKKCRFENKAFYHYRVLSDSMSHKRCFDLLWEESRLFSSICEALKRNNIYEQCVDFAKKHYETRVFQIIQEKKINNCHIERYQYPDEEKWIDKQVVLYGAGKVGYDYYIQMSKNQRMEIVAWIDKSTSKSTPYVSIKTPSVLDKLIFDGIIVAVKEERLYDEIKNELMVQYGISESLITWSSPKQLW